jgi:cyclopropane fatty-acyl-phospholipid synthase-like methyltransferase
MNSDSEKREHFRQLYQSQPPWDVGHVQNALAEVADEVHGDVLDAGCGTGENALFFAERGHNVYGIDFLEEPIQLAKEKAAKRNLEACFLVMDAMALGELPRQFDTIIDCGLFHTLSDEDRPRYVAALAETLKPGGRMWMMCFSDKEPGEEGPRRISPDDIHEAFSSGWIVERLELTNFETSPHAEHVRFSPGGPIAYRVLVRRDEQTR